ncbi:MAG: hypothetical protein IPL22_22450 [Bacteroidetes bacterium]|nr:hypothetical protein [Bacteroidota bacterium]
MWSREPEQEILDVCQELGITFVAYKSSWSGFLNRAIKSRADLEQVIGVLHFLDLKTKR